MSVFRKKTNLINNSQKIEKMACKHHIIRRLDPISFDYNMDDDKNKNRTFKALILIVKLTKPEKIRLREARNELSIIIKKSREIRFNYIVKHKEREKICFGTTLYRDAHPIQGRYRDPNATLRMPEFRKTPAVGDYEVAKKIIKKYAAKEGYTGLSYRSIRLPLLPKPDKDIPPLGKYNPYPWTTYKKCYRPFNIGEDFDKTPRFMTPSPATYMFPQRNVRVSMAFGKSRKIFNAVRTICSPTNKALCRFCELIPIGDYYHNFESKEDVCQYCMRKNLADLKSCGKKTRKRIHLLAELKKFVKVRYCGFYHDHNGTMAAVMLMPRKDLKTKINCENYLATYGIK